MYREMIREFITALPRVSDLRPLPIGKAAPYPFHRTHFETQQPEDRLPAPILLRKIKGSELAGSGPSSFQKNLSC
jgi:hypothetical protein